MTHLVWTMKNCFYSTWCKSKIASLKFYRSASPQICESHGVSNEYLVLQNTNDIIISIKSCYICVDQCVYTCTRMFCLTIGDLLLHYHYFEDKSLGTVFS